jgi:hypothetical protein
VTIRPGLEPTANLAGTISSSGNLVTGSATSFTTTMAVGNYVKAANQFKLVTSIANNISMRVDSAFNTNLVANNYQSTYKGTGTANSSLSISEEYILVTDDWDYIVTIEDV